MTISQHLARFSKRLTSLKLLGGSGDALKEGSSSKATALPLMSAEEIVHYADELAALAARTVVNPKPSEALRQGEQTSRFMGAGLEYEESRPYQPGDEIRRINWRLMARTGHAYTKLFQEERQESWFILIDQRASMRFGTRKRLKATQAVRVAGYFAWIAQQFGIPVSAGRLAEGFEITPIYEGKSSYAHLMESVCLPVPPMSAATEPRLNDILLELNQQLQPGSRLIVVSDFHDIDDHTAEILTALQQQVMLKAVWVEDRSEMELPQIEGLRLQSMVDGSVLSMDSNRQRQNYQAWSQDYQQQLLTSLQQANAAVYKLQAHDSLAELHRKLQQTLTHSGPAENPASATTLTNVQENLQEQVDG